MHLAAKALAGALVLLAPGALGAAHFLPLTPTATTLAASLAAEPMTSPPGVVDYDEAQPGSDSHGDGTVTLQRLATRLADTTLSNHDSDGDGLIQITTVEQLNAVRYDLDGNGTAEDDDSTEGVDEAAAYAAAFPVASDGSVCPEGTSCAGYELMNDLDLDTDGDGTADDGDTYWNNGAGWQPIGVLNAGFAATFEGNGRSINNLFIDRSEQDHMGLFGLVGEDAEIRNVALVDLSVTGSRYVGGLVGQLKESTVSGASTAGTVAGNRGRIGGLVGDGQNSIIEDSRSSATVTAMGSSGRAGGLVGELQKTGSEGGVKSVVRRSYATGTVSSNQSRVGGLVGNLHQQNTPSALVVASYATGAVSGSGSVGGLVGRSSGEVRASYATGAVSGDNKTGGLVGDNRGAVTASYFDTDTSEQTDAAQGKTTAELQAPTGYETPADNIYAQWNVDLDGDDTNDDPWDFGAGFQYPVLKVDGLDDDTTATWQEFGGQLRARLVVSVNATATSVTLNWTAPAQTDYPGAPTITYQVYRDGTPIGAAQAGLTYTDAGLTAGFTHVYRVDVLLNGEPVRGSNAAAAPPSLSVSIADAEGVEGGNLSFTVTKTGAGAVSLNWTASIGESDTAAITDLGATTSGTVDVAASDTTKIFTVAAAQDTVDEDNETFTVTLSATAGMPNVTDGTATGTITDDDESAGAPTGLTASTGSGQGEIDLSWTAPSDTGVLNGTDPAAITGYQYRRAESSAGLDSAAWTAAETATNFTVTGLTGGTTYHFQVRALNGVTPGGAASNEDSATTRALSSDANLSALVISLGTLSPEFAAAKTAYTAAVANSVASLAVTPTAADSNATIAANGSAVTSGSPSEAIALTIGPNIIKVVVTAEDGTKKTYTITATRAGPSISIADAEGAEGGNVSFTVTKTGAGAVSLNWTASIEESDTAATADLGTTTSGAVEFAYSDTGKTFTVQTVQDAMDENDETFTVTLSATAGMPNVTDGTATGTITDDDESAGAPTGLTASTGSGQGEIDLSWTAPSDTGVLNGTDPASITGYQYRRAESNAGLASAVWNSAGNTTAFTVTDLTGGTTYHFQVRALNGVTPGGAASNEDSAAAKALPGISIADAEGAEGGNISFTVTKTGAGAVSLNWTASIGESDTATSADLGPTTSGTVAFNASDASKTFTVETVQDVMDEIDETFAVTLTVASGPASLSVPTAAGAITDDDESVGAPTGLMAMAGTNGGEVDLVWTAPSDTGVLNGADPAAITGYQYRQSESSLGLDSAAWQNAGTATTYTVTALTGGTTYYFQVRALNGVTPEGAASNEDSATAKALPGISIADAGGLEGGNLSFTVTKTGTGSVSLNWTASIGESDTAATADLGATTSGTVEFAASDTTKTFTVAAAQDAIDENDETFTVTLSATAGMPNVTDGTATGTITDDDESAGAPTGLTASTGSGQGEIDLSWIAPSDTGVLNGADPAAITGYQYRRAESSAGLPSAAWTDAGTATTYTVTGLTGGTTYYFQVRALNGVTPEGEVSAEDSAAAKALPGISIADAEGAEAGNVSFTVTKTGAGAVSLNWTASIEESDTAAAADLGTTTSGAVEFAASDTTKTFTVAAAQDTMDENDETFTVTLTATAGMPNVTDGTATGTITDDDESAGAPTSLMASTGSGEGEIDLVWTAPSDTGVLNGTDPAAITGYQYRQSESSAGLASAVWNSAGNTTAFTVTDLTGGTTFHFQVRALNGVTPGGAASIEDSATTKALPGISIADAEGAEGGNVSFTVTKTGAGAVSLNWTASIGESDTATSADLGATTSGTVAFTASDTTKTFTVAAAQDAVDEDNETFTVTLTATSGTPNVTDGTATGTITDDDKSAGAPTGLTASTGSGEGEIDLSWTAPSDTGVLNGIDPAAITGYQYRRAESSAELASAAWQNAGTATTYTVTGLTGGTTYYFQVRALNGVTPGGAASIEDSATTSAPSSDANLVALVISHGTLSPDFISSETAYTATVDNNVDSLTVTPTAADSNATIAVNDSAVASSSVSGAIGLDVGPNVIDVAVTSEDGMVKRYTITVTRTGPSLSVADAAGGEGGKVIFTVSKTGEGAVTLHWTASFGGSDTATSADLGPTTSGTVAFNASDASKTFTVETVQDVMDEIDETFTVTLTVASGPASLSIPTAAGAITDDDESAGAPTGLTASTGSGQGEIDLSWTAPSDTGVLNGTDPATITGYEYRQSESSLGLDSAAWQNAGTATTYTVTGLTGGTTYYFQVRALNGVTPEGEVSAEDSATAKATSSNANLSGLEISLGTLSPGFAAEETEYTVTLANLVTSITVTPTAADSNATIAVNGSAVPSGASSGPIALRVGANVAGVIVTAEDGTEKKYTISVRRAEPSTPLHVTPNVPSSHSTDAPDPSTSLAMADANGIEGSDLTFTVNKRGAGAVSLNWTASIEQSDTARTEDLGAVTSGTVAFNASENSKTFTVATAQDAMDENNETFTVTLTVTSGTAKVAGGTAAGTITDDDQAAGAPIGLTASTGSGEGEIDLSWNKPSNTGVLNGADPAAVTSYQYRLAESSGALPSALWTTAGTATHLTATGLTAGTTYYFQVRALNGVTPEGAASDEASAGAKALPAVSIDDATGVEGSGVSFTVSKKGAGAVSLNWTASIGEPDTAAIADLGATTSGTVPFADSDTSKTFTVATAQDSIDENNETFTVTLTVTSGTARVADGTATGTITDDDQAAGAPIGLTASPGSGESEIHLSWNNPSNTGVLNGADPAAVTSYEYRLAESSGALLSAPWTTAGTATHLTATELTAGTTYYFQVRALNGVTPEGAASDEASAGAKALPAVSIDDATGVEGSGVSFTVSKTGVGVVTLEWTASIGEPDTAAIADLGATTSGSVAFADSNTSKTFTVATAQDASDEDDETFSVTLIVTSGTAIVTNGTATGTITDDDRAAGAPTGLTAATGSGVGELDLSWTAPSDTGVLNGADPAAVTGYQYRLAESSGALPSAPWTTAGTATNYTVSGLAGGTAYYFQVRALNGVTPEGEASTEASGPDAATGTPAPPLTPASDEGADDNPGGPATGQNSDDNPQPPSGEVGAPQEKITPTPVPTPSVTPTPTPAFTPTSTPQPTVAPNTTPSPTTNRRPEPVPTSTPGAKAGPTATFAPTAAPSPTVVAPAPTQARGAQEDGNLPAWVWLVIGIAALATVAAGAYALYRKGGKNNH